MLQARLPRFALRSYHPAAASHAHEHAQAVLPLVGSMDLAGGDRSGRVADGVGVMVLPSMNAVLPVAPGTV